MIQIDLPMPEACDVCPFNYDFCWCNAFGNHDEWEKYSDDWNDHVCDRKTRPEYCPPKKQEAVVLCKNCKYGSWWSDENVIVCDKFSKTRNKNWFCADGERRTDDA